MSNFGSFACQTVWCNAMHKDHSFSVMARYKVESVPNVVNVQECNDSIECNFHIRKNNLNVLIIVNIESTVIIKL